MPLKLKKFLEHLQSYYPECTGQLVVGYDIKTDTATTWLVDPDHHYCEDCRRASGEKFTKHVEEVQAP